MEYGQRSRIIITAQLTTIVYLILYIDVLLVLLYKHGQNLRWFDSVKIRMTSSHGSPLINIHINR